MKSNATMYRLAKLAAMRAGPRDWMGKAVGFYLDGDEMRKLFTTAGFNTWSSVTWIQRVESWPDAFDDVESLGLGAIYVKIFDTENKLRLEKAARDLGYDTMLGFK